MSVSMGLNTLSLPTPILSYNYFRTGAYPWDAGRADVLKSFNLRLPEPILFQLRYIGEYTPYSMQQFCIEHLTVAIQEKIAELTGEK